jgi:hypothetical protein
VSLWELSWVQRFENAGTLPYVYKVKQSLYRPVTSPEDFRISRLPYCETIGKREP